MVSKQTFIVAVSGGVDSVVLLHRLMENKPDEVRYIVAHFDHGIREDSDQDEQFVRELAQSYDLEYVTQNGQLGAHASEAEARDARYAFLREMAAEFQAEKIITAHHQDDVIESMIINMLRGTGPRGLHPMTYSQDILRPLLNRRKSDLLEYAYDNELQWREDPSNEDEKYLRNYVRKHIMPNIEPARDKLLRIQAKTAELYHEIDFRMVSLTPTNNILNRMMYVSLPWSVQRELMRAWLVRMGVSNLDKKQIERLAMSAKTLNSGSKTDINDQLWLQSEKQNVMITSK